MLKWRLSFFSIHRTAGGAWAVVGAPGEERVESFLFFFLFFCVVCRRECSPPTHTRPMWHKIKQYTHCVFVREERGKERNLCLYAPGKGKKNDSSPCLLGWLVPAPSFWFGGTRALSRRSALCKRGEGLGWWGQGVGGTRGERGREERKGKKKNVDLAFASGVSLCVARREKSRCV